MYLFTHKGLKTCALLSCFMLLSTSGFAEEFKRGDVSFYIEPSPNWAVKNSYPLANDKQSEVIDIDYLLFDRQINAQAQQPSQYYHLAEKPTNIYGLEAASKLEISFDPNYEQLIFHSIQLVRNGKAMDVLDAKKIKLLSQELELNQGLINGKITAFMVIPSSKLGDVIDYSYSIKGHNPIFKQQLFFYHQPEADVPIGHSYFRLITNNAQPFHHQLTRLNAAKLQIKRTSNSTEYIYQDKMTRSHSFEDHTPSWYSPYPLIEFSEFASWQQVSEWAEPMYRPNALSHHELIALIQRLKPLPQEQQIIKALRFVQDEIRYLGLELASNSQQPHAPDIVMQRRFGDCKDKTLLFNTLLHQLGITAYPALVNSQYQHKIAQMQPSPGAFDHVLSLVELKNGQQFWLDPSQSLQAGSLSRTAYHSYGHALLVGHAQQNLVTMPAEQAQDNRKETLSQFWISSYQQAVDLQITTRYLGQYADWKRHQITSNSLRRIEQFHFDFIQEGYRDLISNGKFEIDDNKERNILTTTEHYRIYNYFDIDKDGYHYDFDAYKINASLTPANSMRHSPLSLVGPGTHVHTITIHLPDVLMASYEQSITKISNNNISYRSERDNRDNNQHFSYSLQIKSKAVLPDELANYRQALEEIQFDTFEQWALDIEPPTDAEQKQNTILELLSELEQKHVKH